jgi:hypothetical protein
LPRRNIDCAGAQVFCGTGLIDPITLFRVEENRLMRCAQLRAHLPAVIQSINIKPPSRFILEQKNISDVADVVTDKNRSSLRDVE